MSAASMPRQAQRRSIVPHSAECPAGRAPAEGGFVTGRLIHFQIIAAPKLRQNFVSRLINRQAGSMDIPAETRQIAAPAEWPPWPELWRRVGCGALSLSGGIVIPPRGVASRTALCTRDRFASSQASRADRSQSDRARKYGDVALSTANTWTADTSREIFFSSPRLRRRCRCRFRRLAADRPDEPRRSTLPPPRPRSISPISPKARS